MTQKDDMRPILLTDARVLDAVAGELTGLRNVLIQAGKIAAISDAPISAEGANTIDLGGLTLMPGLCDAHVHVTAISADFAALKETPPAYVSQRAGKLMEDTVKRGFTTVRDAGGADYGLAMAVEEGLIKGPRLLYCGHALSQTGGHGDVRGPGQGDLDQCMCCSGFGHVCDGISEVLKSAREEIRRGATHLKIMASGGVSSPTDRITSTQFSEDELRAIVGEAEAAMIPVMAHCYTARAINRAIRCGVTSIEHGNLLDESSVELMLEHGTWLVPTLIIYKSLIEEGVDAGMPAHLVEKTYAVLDAGEKALKLAYDAGVKIAYGTDLLGIMQRHQTKEFAIRAACVSNDDLVRQATVNAAELFGMADRIGQVKEGFLADLIAVDGNPLDDINVLVDHENSLKLVMKEGEVMLERLQPI